MSENIDDPVTIEELQMLYEALKLAALIEPPTNFDGYVYLVEYNGDYKIGRSVDPYTRIRQFSKIVLPHDYEILFSFPCQNAALTERATHEAYAKEHIRGEWFRFDERLLIDVKAFIMFSSDCIADANKIMTDHGERINRRLGYQWFDAALFS